MLAPLSWLKEYVDIDVSAKELEDVEGITQRVFLNIENVSKIL